MRRSMIGWAVAMAAMAGTAAAQEEKAPSAPPPPDLGFELPKPGPEQEILTRELGVWDATVEMWMQPGGSPEVTRGVETNTLVGGLWRVQDFKGEMLGRPYHGQSFLGYDSLKQKYVGTWIDSMAPGLSLTEGTYDAATKTLTQRIEGPCPAGIVMKFRSTTEYKDDGTRVTTMYSPEGQGEEFVMMRISYTRRADGSTAAR
jgi:hypothetical protein